MHQGVPHTYPLVPTPGVVRLGMRPAGYGAFLGKPNYPQITIGATDRASDGAVSFVASKVLGEDTYPLFDQRLLDAVRQYQRERNLLVDGIVGRDTYRAMGYEMPVSSTKTPFFQRGWVLPAGIVLAAVAVGAGIVFWPRRALRGQG
jgi:peptidoglycan hydrolase-like protein with peptidoglycan-binding domain